MKHIAIVKSVKDRIQCAFDGDIYLEFANPWVPQGLRNDIAAIELLVRDRLVSMGIRRLNIVYLQCRGSLSCPEVSLRKLEKRMVGCRLFILVVFEGLACCKDWEKSLESLKGAGIPYMVLWRGGGPLPPSLIRLQGEGLGQAKICIRTKPEETADDIASFIFAESYGAKWHLVLWKARRVWRYLKGLRPFGGRGSTNRLY